MIVEVVFVVLVIIKKPFGYPNGEIAEVLVLVLVHQAHQVVKVAVVVAVMAVHQIMTMTMKTQTMRLLQLQCIVQVVVLRLLKKRKT
ncbi:hypothetical protein Q764_01760 [Flavobacterium suncheonense GH29-5 = DSM 17707]|uniref:Uncharacterized protein n=1 Tax=Flavobacterium suncheonense GH29-5 = DSM 17707 TaxID=1121899 RepID=A0A0A2MPU9_9FLAO|nr:hypothetical protein Q764_01760 [Flavobacterium suncheonense GH29-5 = DSM 17707]